LSKLITDMDSDKRKFLIRFYDFLDSFEEDAYGICYFKLLDGQECQGWIKAINDLTFEFHDSGPFASEKSYVFEIENIDTNTFAYWDEASKKWTEYLESEV
jgi:hypothetical protein